MLQQSKNNNDSKEQESRKVEEKKNESGLADVLKFEKWIASLGELNATDLHLAVGNVPMVRIDGKIKPLLNEDVIVAERIQSIIEHLLSDKELKQLEMEREIIVSRTLKKIMRFRIHVFYSRGFPSVSMRHIKSVNTGLKELGLPQVVSELASSDQGLFIVAGPFDSGKTTTITAIINEINHKESKYIVTLESPVEHVIPSDKSVVVQREVGHDVTTYSQGIDTLLNEDVNVIVIGSLLKENIMEGVLELANSGRLVIASAQCRNATNTLAQIRDSVPENGRERILGLLSESLLGVVVQLLMPKIGGGRTIIYEILRATNPVKSLIRDNKIGQITNFMQTSRQEGMVTMDMALAEAVKLGKITPQDAQEQAIDKEQFNTLVSR